MDELVYIHKYRFNGQFSNAQYSTNPIVPKYHVTFGQPLDRQEVSSEFEMTKDSDPKKAAA